MHTTETDGRNSIREMAEAGIARGYEYIAITDHSKALAMTNGLDEKRALEHIAADSGSGAGDWRGGFGFSRGSRWTSWRMGRWIWTDEVLAQMDVVIASIHSLFNQSREEMTARMLRAIENPHVRILGHPTGRLILRREPFAIDMGAVIRRAVELGVAMEHNACAGTAGSVRSRPAAGEGAGMQDRDQHGCARCADGGQDELRSAAAEAGVAGAGGCAEYAGGGGVFGRAASAQFVDRSS